MRKKNKKHKEISQRKTNANQTLQKFDLQLDSNLISVGITCCHTHSSQINYFLFKAINELLREYSGFDIHLFTEHLSPIMMTLLCPIFDISKITEFDYPILATTWNSCFDLSYSTKNIIYHYISDIGPIINNKNNAKKIIMNPRIINIVRCQAYRDIIDQEFELDNNLDIISDVDIEKLIIKIIREMANGFVEIKS